MTTNQLITKIGRQRVLTALSNVVCSSSSSGGGTWGSITGTLSNQTDLQNALNAKQDALVNQTNIKSINSNSLLGSGDISVATLLGYTPSRRIIHKNNVSDSFTGTTNPSILASILIPAGTVGANDVMNVVVRCRKSGTNGNFSITGRIHTSGGAVGTAFSSGTVFFISGTFTATTIYVKMQRELIFKNSLSSFTVFPTGTSPVMSDIVNTTVDVSTLTNDFSQDQYIVIVGFTASASDTAIIDHVYIEIIR